MAIITISRGCFSHGKEIAERVADRMGYACASREILLEASQLFQVSEKKLLQSLHDAPSILEKITHGKERYLAYIRAALLEYVTRDNIIYHGHAGHLLIPEIKHLIRVRVIAQMDMRIVFLRQQQSMSEQNALTFLKNEDKARRLWTRYLYNVDIEDPRLYDLILNIGEGLEIEDACEIICHTARLDTFKATSESKKIINDLAIQKHILAALQNTCDAEVTSKNGFVQVCVRAQKIRRTNYINAKSQLHMQDTIKDELCKEVLTVAQNVPGVKHVACDIEPPYYC